MNLRFLTGILCGSAFTLTAVSFADPRPQNQCTMAVSDINTRLSAMEKNIAAIPAVSSDVSTLIAANAATVKWQSTVVQKLDEINMNILHFQYSTTLR